MKFDEWKVKPESAREAECQQLNPYEDWDLFKSFEAEFQKEHGAQPGVASVYCGLGPGLGPYNTIVVEIKRGEKRTTLPRTFMGFPVERKYQKKTGQ